MYDAGVNDAMHPAWFVFLLSAFLIYLAGTRLTSSASNIARETGLGGLWVGLIILPLSTSLPELVTSWRAVSIGAPDLAVGNFLGSNLVNIAMIALVDLVQGKGALFKHISSRHKTTVLFVASMTLLVIVGMLLPEFNLCHFPHHAPLVCGVPGSRPFHAEVRSRRTGRSPASKKQRHSLQGLDYLYPVFCGHHFGGGEPGRCRGDFGRGYRLWTHLHGFLFTGHQHLPAGAGYHHHGRPHGSLGYGRGQYPGSQPLQLSPSVSCRPFYREGGLLSALSPLHFITALMGIFLAALVYLGLARPSRVLLGDVGLNSLFIAALYIFSIVLLFLFGVQF
jgi:cation:H+ antiporter